MDLQLHMKDALLFTIRITNAERLRLLSLLDNGDQDVRIRNLLSRTKRKKTHHKEPTWESQYKPGDRVVVPHHNEQVEAILIRKKHRPQYAWMCQKLVNGKWTLESIITDSRIISKTPA